MLMFNFVKYTQVKRYRQMNPVNKGQSTHRPNEWLSSAILEKNKFLHFFQLCLFVMDGQWEIFFVDLFKAFQMILKLLNVFQQRQHLAVVPFLLIQCFQCFGWQCVCFLQRGWFDLCMFSFLIVTLEFERKGETERTWLQYFDFNTEKSSFPVEVNYVELKTVHQEVHKTG